MKQCKQDVEQVQTISRIHHDNNKNNNYKIFKTI